MGGCRQKDYYPFGMVMEDRQYTSASYRYGFQGQEHDDEIKGEGNSINFKFRIHDPRIGRFFSLDPLSKDYPYNSPYAFSENRVIDGIELEGLEYATFTILVVDGKVTAIDVTTDYELKNKNTKGPGIEYIYIHVNSAKNEMTTTTDFVQNRYGIYQGEFNPQLPKVGGSWKVVYDDYSLEPIDEQDDNAKQHDQDFDKQNLKGISGLLNPQSTPYNESFIERAEEVIRKFENKEKDLVTDKPVTEAAEKAARHSKALFEGIEEGKKFKDYIKNEYNMEKIRPATGQ